MKQYYEYIYWYDYIICGDLIISFSLVVLKLISEFFAATEKYGIQFTTWHRSLDGNETLD